MIGGQRATRHRDRDQRPAEEQDGFVVLRAAQPTDQRIGIYARGGCHLRAVFACARLIQEVLRGTCGIYYDGLNARGRCDLVLQTLQHLPEEWTEPVTRKLHLPRDYFRPDLFEDTFTLEDNRGPEQFRKDVIMLHIGADLSGRVAYRHRQHGFLVDPGGGWLLDLEAVLEDLDSVNWFRQNFEPVPRLSTDAFADNLATIVRLLRERNSPRIVVCNSLMVHVDTRTHTWQLMRQLNPIRWRELNEALYDLSRQLDFAVLDLDRVLKFIGVRSHGDLIRLNPEQNLFLAREMFRIMRDTGVFD